jgi:hypothetical protein
VKRWFTSAGVLGEGVGAEGSRTFNSVPRIGQYGSSLLRTFVDKQAFIETPNMLTSIRQNGKF